MEILSTRSLSSEDALTFGRLNVPLGQLIRAGVTDIDSITISPPEIEIKIAAQYFDLGHRELFEQSLNLAKQHLLKQNISEGFAHILKNKRCFFEGKVYLKYEKLWQALIDSWFFDFSQMSSLVQLEAKTVCIVGKVANYGIAFWDEMNSVVAVKDALKNLKPDDTENIAQQVKEADKKLMLPYKYNWILEEDKIKICGVENHNHDLDKEILVKKPHELLSVQAKPAVLITKIYQHLTDDIIIPEFDGIYIDPAQDKDPEDHRLRVFKAKQDTTKHILINDQTNWLEAKAPEHILGIESYFKDDLYGVVINLSPIIERIYESETRDMSVLRHMFDIFFAKISNKKLFVLVLWDSQDYKFLEYLILKGTKGVIIKRHDLDVMQDILGKIEKRILLLGQMQK